MVDTFSSAERSRIMRGVRGKDTTPEMIVRRIVHALGYRYRLHVRSLPGVPDIVLPRHRKIIDVRGCFWHMHTCGRCRIPATRREEWRAKLKRNAKRDRENNKRLKKAGWQVLVVWECVAGDRSKVNELLREFLATSGK